MDAAARSGDDEESAPGGCQSCSRPGKSIFKEKCQKCHGPGGKGDGPDADPDAQEDMDLTRANRAAKNPDGVVFYKVFNGRKKPKMPATKGRLDQGTDLVRRRLRADAAENDDTKKFEVDKPHGTHGSLSETQSNCVTNSPIR